jgi:hexosaminidase
VEFFISDDGIKFQKVAEKVNDINPLSGEKQLKEFVASFNPVSAKFIKIVATNLGKCPKGHAGEGKAAWLFIDEIMVE